MSPSIGILALTLNCNSRCVMCDIWKNKMTDEMLPSEYNRLPASLRLIYLAGGEPYLRDDLPEIAAVCKHKNPMAGLSLVTHGFMPQRVCSLTREILKYDSNPAVTVSLDGLKSKHEEIRRIPGGYDRVLETLSVLKSLSLKRIAISFTLMEQNKEEFWKVYVLSRKMKIKFVPTIPVDSPIYFGMNKKQMQIQNARDMHRLFTPLLKDRYWSWRPSSWFRGWFETHLLRYTATGKRPVPCTAAEDFFYLDSQANVYACHVLPYKLGSLRETSWEALWTSPQADHIRKTASRCHQCWQTCTLGLPQKYLSRIFFSAFRHYTLPLHDF